MEFRVWSLGFSVWGLDLGFRVWDLDFVGLGFRVWCFGVIGFSLGFIGPTVVGLGGSFQAWGAFSPWHVWGGSSGSDSSKSRPGGCLALGSRKWEVRLSICHVRLRRRCCGRLLLQADNHAVLNLQGGSVYRHSCHPY